MSFKKYRAKKYNKLKWVNSDSYIKDIIEFSKPKKNDLVLDVGTGTGVIANAFISKVNQVIGVDISKEMLEKKHGHFSSLLWDIQKPLFKNDIFNIVVARMSLHHIENLEKTLNLCYDYLKNDGSIIIAEGIPPTEDKYVVEWYTKMFKMKEERHTFTKSILTFLLECAGFKKIEFKYNTMNNFSINNWLNNSGLSKTICNKICKMHRESTAPIKDVFKMRFIKNDIIIKTTNIIIKGIK